MKTSASTLSQKSLDQTTFNSNISHLRLTKKVLVERLDVMWDQISAWKELPGGLEAFKAFETSTANPIGLPPLSALSKANKSCEEDPRLLSEYQDSGGLHFIKDNMAEYFNELGCAFLEKDKLEVTKDNVIIKSVLDFL